MKKKRLLLPAFAYLGLLGAFAVSQYTIHEQRKTIDLEMQAIETWKTRALVCENGGQVAVLKR